MPDTHTRTQHTPGPWTEDVHRENRIGIFGKLSDGEACWIAEVNNCIFEGAENARLIAAAPDLLAALDNAEGWLEGLSSEVQLESQAEFYEMWDQVKAAIRKARGEE